MDNTAVDVRSYDSFFVLYASKDPSRVEWCLEREATYWLSRATFQKRYADFTATHFHEFVAIYGARVLGFDRDSRTLADRIIARGLEAVIFYIK